MKQKNEKAPVSGMFEYKDTLDPLNKNTSLVEKLCFIHKIVKDLYSFINRISIAIYEPKTELLKTYVDSSDDTESLRLYQAKLSEAPSLQEILVKGNPRVINDIDIFKNVKEHTQRIKKTGSQASYTMPMYYNDVFFGFVFFNAKEKNIFTPEILNRLNLFGHMLSLLTINEITSIRTLVAAIKTVNDLAHHRDHETGSHLDRMSRFSRIIAQELALKHTLNDDYIEHVFMFSPLHDIGKIGIPDHILLKPGRLSAEEFEIMKTHSQMGREMIDEMLENFGLDALQHIDILQNIAEYHHESINGEGYPKGLKGNDIPIESRIVAVADVFDALTSHRPYKNAWSNDEAFAALKKLADNKLDKDCVNALLRNREKIEDIQKQFQEDPFG